MRVKRKRKFQRGEGVFKNPSGREILSGWGGGGFKMKRPSVGGYGYFLELHSSFPTSFK